MNKTTNKTREEWDKLFYPAFAKHDESWEYEYLILPLKDTMPLKLVVAITLFSISLRKTKKVDEMLLNFYGYTSLAINLGVSMNTICDYILSQEYEVPDCLRDIVDYVKQEKFNLEF